MQCYIFYWRQIYSVKWTVLFPETTFLPSSVTAFWWPSSKPSAGAGHVKAQTLYSGSKAEPKPKPKLEGLPPSSSQGLCLWSRAGWPRSAPQHPGPSALTLHVPWLWAMPPLFPQGSTGAQTGAATTCSWDHRWPRQTDSQSVHTVGRASDGQIPKAQLASSCVLSLPLSPYGDEGSAGLSTVLGHEDRAALRHWLFLVKEQEAEPAVGCLLGFKNPKAQKRSETTLSRTWKRWGGVSCSSSLRGSKGSRNPPVLQLRAAVGVGEGAAPQTPEGNSWQAAEAMMRSRLVPAGTKEGDKGWGGCPKTQRRAVHLHRAGRNWPTAGLRCPGRGERDV